MGSIRKLVFMALGGGVDLDRTVSDLKSVDVPYTTEDCRSCPNPCEEDWHEPYPKFDVDMESQMLGSVKPYRRQVVVSTGKSDWPREVTDVLGSLAAYLLDVEDSVPSLPVSKGKLALPGVFKTADSTKLSILNGSHHTLSDDIDRDTVLVFPDYKVVTEVPRSLSGAQDLWTTAVDPGLGQTGAVLENTLLKTWILQYSCVILLCSHKKRDNRCSIVAPKLEKTFTHALEREGWEVHTQLEHLCMTPLENFKGTEEEKQAYITCQLKDLSNEKKALILRNSHIGGHKYAGNVVIYTPQGSAVWYGRVTTHEVESIVTNTIIGGKVLPTLLRGGLNISRPGCASLNDW